MPKAAPTDFVVQVEGIGPFTFARRTMRLQLSLDVAKHRLAEGLPVAGELAVYIEALATLQTLTVQSPEDWDLDGGDPLDAEPYARVVRVWEALREQEETFRRPAQVGGEAQGA